MTFDLCGFGMDRGFIVCGEKSAITLMGRLRSWLAYGEFRRLTMRGLMRPLLLTQRSVAACASSC